MDNCFATIDAGHASLVAVAGNRATAAACPRHAGSHPVAFP